MVPVKDTSDLTGSFEFLRNITKPRGSIKLLGIEPFSKDNSLAKELDAISSSFRKKACFHPRR